MQELIEKFEKLKLLMSHHCKEGSSLSYAELFEKLADLGLKKLDPEQKPAFKLQRIASPPEKLQEELKTEPVVEIQMQERQSQHRSYIPIEDRRFIWQRAKGSCEYTDKTTEHRCNSKWALELDHITPLVQNGKNERTNYRLVCRNHNTWLAIQAFGLEQMQRYLKG